MTTTRQAITGQPSNRRQDVTQMLLPGLADGTEAVRRALVLKLPHGAKDQLARMLHISPSQLSRQLNGAEGLHLRTALYACKLLEPGDAVALWTLMASEIPSAIEERKITLFRLPGDDFFGVEGH